MKRKMLFIFLMVLLVATSFSGVACSKAEPAPTTTPTVAPTTAPTTAPPAKDMPKSGGVLNVPQVKVPAGFDVHRKTSYSPVIGYMVFNSLVWFDPNIRELSPGNLRGDLAESWDTSADGLTVTFNLFKNVKWHDGQPFTADDVVYSLEKILDPDRSSVSTYFPEIDSVSKTDDYTVVVKLKYPSVGMLTKLAGPYTVIQAKHLADVDNKTTDFLVGTGPFMLGDYTSGINYEFKKYPDYHKTDEFGQQLPYLDAINMYIITDRSAHGDAFVTKRIDMFMPVLGAFFQSNIDKVQAEAPDAIIDSYSNRYGMAYWFNQDSEGLDDLRVRQALVMLIDRPTLRTAGYGNAEWGTYDQFFFNPSFGLPKDEIYKSLGWDLPWDTRVANAQKLMADAGYADGFELRITCRTAEQLEREITTLADVYETYLNMDVTLNVVDMAVLNLEKGAGDFDIILNDILSYTGDPDEIVGNFKTGSAANFLKYSDPEMDRLIDAQAREGDVAKRAELTRDIERMLIEDLPIVSSTFGRYWSAWWPDVKGFHLQNVGYGSRMRYEQVWLDR